jgi:CubicO group peptidase (beta-lactamase class C family)
VSGLDSKFARIRFIDAANMASGFGGAGTLQTNPNDSNDGYLGGDYDAWYTAASHDEKLAQIAKDLRPYPWDPGVVVRYQDQDFYLLGVAIDRFLKSVRGPQADAWNMLRDEVFAPIGIAQAPAIRTHEAGGGPGITWFNAGYYTQASTTWRRSLSCIRTRASGAISRSCIDSSHGIYSLPTKRC